VLPDEIPGLQDLAIRTRVNGETVQDGTTASMIFPVAEAVAFLSQIMTLEPGDIIATGTPAGHGNARDPQLSPHPGDTAGIEITGIGTLRNGSPDKSERKVIRRSYQMSDTPVPIPPLHHADLKTIRLQGP
jgi:2-keto-4-pentenoate hydratase/2-oxohepta-3-ene-1,7-dioic acid hydratase in catechol pathway